MRKLLYALAAVMLLSASWAQAQGPEFRSDHPERYTVKRAIPCGISHPAS